MEFSCNIFQKWLIFKHIHWNTLETVIQNFLHTRNTASSEHIWNFMVFSFFGFVSFIRSADALLCEDNISKNTFIMESISVRLFRTFVNFFLSCQTIDKRKWLRITNKAKRVLDDILMEQIPNAYSSKS